MKKFDNGTRKEVLENMNAAWLRLRNQTFLLIGILVVSLLAAVTKQMIPSVACLALMVVFRLTLHRKARKDYQQAMTDAALTCSVGAKLDQFELSAKGGTGLRKEEIRETSLLPVREGADSFITLYQGISGTLKDMEISLNDVTFQQYQHAGQKGADVACGIWMRLALPKDTGLDLRILSKDIIADDLREEFFAGLPEFKKQDAAEAGFREKQLLYAGSTAAGDAAAISTPAALPDAFVSAVNDLFRKTSGKPAVAVRGNVMSVFLKDRILAPNYRLNTKPEESFLNLDPVPEFRDVLAAAKAL